jgi:hypothetical protein
MQMVLNPNLLNVEAHISGFFFTISSAQIDRLASFLHLKHLRLNLADVLRVVIFSQTFKLHISELDRISLEVIQQKSLPDGLFFEVLFRNVLKGLMVTLFAYLQTPNLFLQLFNICFQTLVVLIKLTSFLLIIENLILQVSQFLAQVFLLNELRILLNNSI